MIVLLEILSNQVLAQQPNDNRVLQKGFYMTKYDLINNSAQSTNVSFDIEEVVRGEGKNAHKQYKVNLYNAKNNFLYEVWGICDGQNVYIKNQDGYYFARNIFEKILVVGKYIVYDATTFVRYGNSTTGNYVSNKYFMDTELDEAFILNKSSILKELKIAPELYEAFKLEENKNKEEVLTNYIIKLNEWYKNNKESEPVQQNYHTSPYNNR
jgi:hypothetical protein